MATIMLTEYRDYFEQIVMESDGISTATMVNTDKEMSNAIRRMKADEFPALFVVVPAAEDSTKSPDDIAEKMLCIVFLLDRSDAQRRRPFTVLTETQRLIEQVKTAMRRDASRPCHFMSGLSQLNTNPETGLYDDYSGWSITFNILVHG